MKQVSLKGTVVKINDTNLSDPIASKNVSSSDKNSLYPTWKLHQRNMNFAEESRGTKSTVNSLESVKDHKAARIKDQEITKLSQQRGSKPIYLEGDDHTMFHVSAHDGSSKTTLRGTRDLSYLMAILGITTPRLVAVQQTNPDLHNILSTFLAFAHGGNEHKDNNYAEQCMEAVVNPKGQSNESCISLTGLVKSMAMSLKNVIMVHMQTNQETAIAKITFRRMCPELIDASTVIFLGRTDYKGTEHTNMWTEPIGQASIKGPNLTFNKDHPVITKIKGILKYETDTNNQHHHYKSEHQHKTNLLNTPTTNTNTILTMKTTIDNNEITNTQLQHTGKSDKTGAKSSNHSTPEKTGTHTHNHDDTTRYHDDHDPPPQVEGMLITPNGRSIPITSTHQSLIHTALTTLTHEESIHPHQINILINGKPYCPNHPHPKITNEYTIIRTSLKGPGGSQQNYNTTNNMKTTRDRITAKISLLFPTHQLHWSVTDNTTQHCTLYINNTNLLNILPNDTIKQTRFGTFEDEMFNIIMSIHNQHTINTTNTYDIGEHKSADDFPATCKPLKGLTLEECITLHLERITESADAFEKEYLGIQNPTCRWTQPDAELEYQCKEILNIAYASKTSVCRTTNCMRIISINEGRSELRYITPYNIWSMIESREIWVAKDPIPTCAEIKNILMTLLTELTPRLRMFETRLQIKSLLEMQFGGNRKIGKTITQKGNSSYQLSLYGTCNENPCITCDDSSHQATWGINHVSKTIFTTCKGKKHKCTRLPMEAQKHFFGNTIYSNQKKEKLKDIIPTSATENKDQEYYSNGTNNLYPDIKDPKLEDINTHHINYPTNNKKSNQRSQTATTRKHNITWIQYNTDKRSNSQLTHIFAYCVKNKVDIICLQEVENNKWLDITITQTYGYTAYRHKKVMILMNQHTVEKIHLSSMIWRSPENDTMSITLLTPEGPLAVINSYIPSGVDTINRDINNETYCRILDSHMEINERALKHTASIITMDGNETTNIWHRIQIHNDPNNTISPSGKQNAESNMSVYEKNMSDAHKLINPLMYKNNEPSHGIYTHQQPSKDMLIKAKIDYCLITKNLADRLNKCHITDEPKQWTEQHRSNPFAKNRSNFHSIIHSSLSWHNIYEQSPQTKRRSKLKGSQLHLGFNTSDLNDTNKVLIAKEIEEELKLNWKNITKLSKGRGTHQYKMQTLTNKLKKIINTTCSKYLRTKSQVNTHKYNDYLEAEERFQNLKKEVRKIIDPHTHNKRTIIPQKDDNPNNQSDKTTLEKLNNSENWYEIKWLIDHKVMQNRPTTLNEWIEWYRSGQNHLALSTQSHLDDKLATTSPKKLYKQICKPMSTTTITSLRKNNKILSSDECIEEELTNYLENIGKPTKPSPNFTKLPFDPTQVNTHYDTILDTPSIQEILDNITSYYNHSSGGYDQISPALLKTICLTEWDITVNKSDLEIQRETTARNTAQELYDLTKEGEVPPPPALTKTMTKTPLYAPHMIQKIIKHSFKAQDIPTSEKLNIVTGLPKKEGQVNDTDNIRPIIGRIINKIISKRLGIILKNNHLIDKAQFAFLPGGDIQEPINTVIQCFSQSLSAANETKQRECYAIFYDISKAYDTIRWDSIENALIKAGSSQSFINFVMNSHKGTKLAMKTNKPNRITPQVEMHKAIKQGCPLAPILFIMIMDELHRGYREIGGYNLGETKVSSRGFCDDTVIISDNLQTIKAMNSFTYTFFEQHGLKVNTTKSAAMGRKKDGTEMVDPIYWPGTDKPLTTATHDEATRYLGIHINMNLNWDAQRIKLDAFLHNITSRLNSKQITLLQGCMLIREVLIPKFEASFKHITIPANTLERWDKTISRAISKRAELSQMQLHRSSIFTIMKCNTLTQTYLMSKALHMMQQITKPSELMKEYQNIINTSIQLAENDTNPKPKKTDNETVKTLKFLTQNNIIIKRNKQCRTRERITSITPVETPQDTYEEEVKRKPKNNEVRTWYFNGEKIPTRDTYDLWQIKRKKGQPAPEHTNYVTSCTDGSTYKDGNWPSGTAYVYMVDGAKYKDLWGIPGYAWLIENCDNYEAELAAINKVIRSVEVHRPIKIFTDSKAAMNAIKKLRISGNSHTLINEAGRPYLMSIIRAITEREKRGVHTQILHVRSHTGKRDIQSIGNNEADNFAKYVTRLQMQNKRSDIDPITTDINKMQNELPYVVHIRTFEENELNEKIVTDTPVHGKLRHCLKKHLTNILLAEWAKREKRGELIRTASTQIIRLLKGTWKTPTSLKIKFLMDILNQANPYVISENRKTKTTKTCSQCTLKAPLTSYHRIAGCPSNGDLWNKAAEDIWHQLGDPININNTHNTEDLETLKTLDTQKQGGIITSIRIGENIMPTSQPQLKKIIRRFNFIKRTGKIHTEKSNKHNIVGTVQKHLFQQKEKP